MPMMLCYTTCMCRGNASPLLFRKYSISVFFLKHTISTPGKDKVPKRAPFYTSEILVSTIPLQCWHLSHYFQNILVSILARLKKTSHTTIKYNIVNVASMLV